MWRWWIGWNGVFTLGVVPWCQALDPALPPGGNFDLAHWKLTLPDAMASDISAAVLEAGYINAAFFYTGTDGAMVFWSPVTGGTTEGSSYSRSELREMLNAADNKVNWTGWGTHVLNAQCRVLQVPSSGRVIIGQIHSFTGNAYPMLKLQFDKGAVEARIRHSPNSSEETDYAFMNVGLSNLISYRIELANGLLTVTVNGSNQTVNVFQTDPAWAGQGLYFKAGSYCQDNVGTAQEGALVSFYALNVTHSGDTRITQAGLNSSRRFGFNLLAYNEETYAIQRSSNLLHWTDVFTNPAAGSFNFTDASSAPAARRFYRARKFP